MQKGNKMRNRLTLLAVVSAMFLFMGCDEGDTNNYVTEEVIDSSTDGEVGVGKGDIVIFQPGTIQSIVFNDGEVCIVCKDGECGLVELASQIPDQNDTDDLNGTVDLNATG